MSAMPRTRVVSLALLMACTSSSGPSPLSEPAGTILAVSNSPGTATAMVIGMPGDSSWRFVTDPELYLGGYVAKLLENGDQAITIVRENFTAWWAIARLDLDSNAQRILLEGPGGTSPDYVAPDPSGDDILFTVYNWNGVPGLSLMRFDPASGTVAPELPEPIVSFFHLEWGRDGRHLFGLQGGNAKTVFLVALDLASSPAHLDTLRTIPSDLVSGPTVSPDGTGLIVSWTEPGGNSGVWHTERLEFTDPDHTTSIPINGYYPAYSPDGRWLAYTDAATQEAWLYRFADGYRRKAFTDDAPRLLIRDWK